MSVDRPNHGTASADQNDWSAMREPVCGKSASVLLLVLLVIGIGIWLWRPTAGLEEILGMLKRAGPIPFFSALMILPLLGVPTTPFYLLAGPTFGPGISLLGTAAALALQQTLGYWLARKWLHGLLESILVRTRFKVPQVKTENHLRFTIVVRLAPGVPSWAKNYLGGLARTPFPIFFCVSWPVGLAYAAGFILLGDAAFSRDWREFIPAALLVLGLIILRKILKSRAGRT